MQIQRHRHLQRDCHRDKESASVRPTGPEPAQYLLVCLVVEKKFAAAHGGPQRTFPDVTQLHEFGSFESFAYKKREGAFGKM